MAALVAGERRGFVTAWHEFPWRQDTTDSTRVPLSLSSPLDGANFSDGTPPPQDVIVVCAYNAERGKKLDEQLQALTGGASGMPAPDVILLSEADRGCTRTNSRNVAEEFARALRMYYVFGVEFVELPRIIGPGGCIRRRCTHGNAILSRYPLGNVRLIRFRESRKWDSGLQRLLHVGEPRLGGRMAVAADVRIGERLLRIYSVHLESGGPGSPHRADDYREAQARELVADAAGVEGGVIIGGDLNVGPYLGALERGEPERTAAALFEAGYADAHAALPLTERVTTDSGVAVDLVFGRGVRFTGAGVGPREVWGGLSDHLPVWARVALG